MDENINENEYSINFKLEIIKDKRKVNQIFNTGFYSNFDDTFKEMIRLYEKFKINFDGIVIENYKLNKKCHVKL